MTFHLYQDLRGEFRWRLVARNGRVVADSAEGYYDEGNLRRALEHICADLGVAEPIIVGLNDNSVGPGE